ncbi:hypothetical protein JCM3775_003182 [Rhodotorula graminis]
MLSDVSNRAPAPSSREPSSSLANNKRPLDLSSEGDAAPPLKLSYKRTLAPTSSSSSPRGGLRSSSPFFQRNRLEAFDLPTSPSSAFDTDKQLVPTSPIQRFSSLASLPPSSPSFGLSALPTPSTAALDDLVAAASGAVASPSSATPTSRDSGLDTPRLWHLERGTVLYFGRKARKALPRDRATTVTHVPVVLPKSAKNASRIHCSVRIVSRVEQELDGALEVEVRVTGQNGMKVDGKVKKIGSVVVLEKQAGQAVRLKFWGWDAKVLVAESELGLDDRDDDEGLPAARRAGLSYLDDDDDDDDALRRARSPSRASSPAYNYSNDHGLSPEPESAPAGPLVPPRPPSSTSSTFAAERASALVTSLNLDLAGLVASAIVFHARSTVAVDEVIRALLKESGGMWRVLSDDDDVVERRKETPEGEGNAVAAWRTIVENVLVHESMFGMIDNAGLKDASGHPIPPHWYYIPDQDPSADRVAALEPFVKRVRGARSKAARYFWAKPSLRKR